MIKVLKASTGAIGRRPGQQIVRSRRRLYSVGAAVKSPPLQQRFLLLASTASSLVVGAAGIHSILTTKIHCESNIDAIDYKVN